MNIVLQANMQQIIRISRIAGNAQRILTLAWGATRNSIAPVTGDMWARMEALARFAVSVFMTVCNAYEACTLWTAWRNAGIFTAIHCRDD